MMMKDVHYLSVIGGLSSNRKATKSFALFSSVIFLLLLWKTTNKLLTTDITFTKDELSNTDCSFENQQMSLKFKQLCNHENQYQKFVWMLIDSMAFEQFEPLLKLPQLQPNYNLFRVMNRNFKNSYAIYSTYYTGQFVSNFAGKQVQSDNLFHQFKMNGYDINMVGAWGPSMKLLSPSYFASAVEHWDETNIFEKLFGTGERAEVTSVHQNLDTLTNYGVESLYIPSGRLDSYHHSFSRFADVPMQAVAQWVENMQHVISWINSHPDYLLIVISDHGGDSYYMESRVNMHGPSDGGNEAFLFFYSPSLKPLTRQKQWIEVVDTCSTIAIYFKGVSIPAESIGVVFPNSENETDIFKVRELNMRQIEMLAEQRGLRVPFREKFDISFGQQPSKAVNDKLESALRTFSQPLAESKQFPLRDVVLFLPLLVTLVTVYLGIFHYSWKDVWENGFNGTGLALHLACIGFSLWHLWFNYWKYHKDVVEEKPIIYYLFSSLALYYSQFAVSHSRPSLPVSSTDFSIVVSSDSTSNMNTYTRSKSSKTAQRSSTTYLLFAIVLGWLSMLAQAHQFIKTIPLPVVLNIFSWKQLCYLVMFGIIAWFEKRSTNKIVKIERTIYALMLLIAYWDESTKAKTSFRWIFYLCFIHTAFLLTSNSQAKRRIVLPVTFITFLLLWESNKERLWLLTMDYVIQSLLTVACDVALTHKTTADTRYYLCSIVLLLVSRSFWSFSFFGSVFSMDLDPNVPSIPSPGDEPILAGILMLWRKYQYFMLTTGFLIRILNVMDLHHPSGTQLFDKEKRIEHSKEHLKMVWFSLVLMWLNIICLALTFSLVYWHYMVYTDCFMLFAIFGFQGLFCSAGIGLPDLTSTFLPKIFGRILAEKRNKAKL